ncbi:MAG: excinuclease ABC subunit UvrA [Oligoflexales bacterium]|nr:excinuclease ABC subunit UvrA [Oligoflexales bacterium]
MNRNIVLQGIATHNLKSIDLELPLYQTTVITGVSGSGKSSLVFDTLYVEAYRRYVESLSSYTRQFMQALPRPSYRKIENLPPAIALKQRRQSRNPRATVASMTEIADLLQILYVNHAQLFCQNCQKAVVAESAQELAKKSIANFNGQNITVTAPLYLWSQEIDALPKSAQLEQRQFLRNLLERQGFDRLLNEGKRCSLAEAFADEHSEQKPAFADEHSGQKPALADKGIEKYEVLLDRLKCDEKNLARLTESIQLAFKLSKGICHLYYENGLISASNKHYCTNCRIEFEAAQPLLFSNEHPLGACSTCSGFGRIAEIDWHKVTPNLNASLEDEEIKPWNFGNCRVWYEVAKKSAVSRGIDTSKSFSEYSEADWLWLRHGDGKKFGGVVAFLRWLESKNYKVHYRIHRARFNRYIVCPDCDGKQLNQRALSYKIDRCSLYDAKQLSLLHFNEWLEKSFDKKSFFKDETLKEIKIKINFLLEIGLSYLSLDRHTDSLSGGEFQRLAISRCLANSMSETLYCLDEPSTGLHPVDTQNLLKAIDQIKNLQNTIVMVEHDEQMIRGADYLVELGPGAGYEGGQVAFQGSLGEIKNDRILLKSLTVIDEYSSSVEENRIANIFSKNSVADKNEEMNFVEVENINPNNLKNLKVKFPIGSLTCVCGVSGSGKSSLVMEAILPLFRSLKSVADEKEQESDRASEGENESENISEEFIGRSKLAARLSDSKQADIFTDVLHIDQRGIGKSSRSNIATYLGVFEDIRKLYSAQALAVKLGLKASDFSFNSIGGRCEECKGLGVIVEDLSFLGEVTTSCPSCLGKCFSDKVLQVTLQGYNLNQLLGLTLTQVKDLLRDQSKIRRICRLAEELGLGYLTLGQTTSTFSGGEIQRLKLMNILQKTKEVGRHLILMDEPSIGLSVYDTSKLINLMRRLCREGHTLIVIEHNLEILRKADWLIEIGPDAGDFGGELLYQGLPFGLKKVKASKTARFI